MNSRELIDPRRLIVREMRRGYALYDPVAERFYGQHGAAVATEAAAKTFRTRSKALTFRTKLKFDQRRGEERAGK